MGTLIRSHPYWTLSEIYDTFKNNPSKNNSIEGKTKNIDIEIHGRDNLVLHIDIRKWGHLDIQNLRIYKFQTIIYDLNLCGKLNFLCFMFSKIFFIY